MRRVVVIAITLVVGLDMTPAHADCARDASELRRLLLDESHHADNWNTGWALGFAGATVIQLAMADAEINPIGTFDHAYKASLYIGAVKSTLGMGARVVIPLRIIVPAPATDPCDDLRALRTTARKAARRERRVFWLTILGGTAANLAGSLYLWLGQDSFKYGLSSFLIGAPVGPISAFTQPRTSWRLVRASRVEWTIGLGSIGGRF
jgi:hypothetical protein